MDPPTGTTPPSQAAPSPRYSCALALLADKNSVTCHTFRPSLGGASLQAALPFCPKWACRGMERDLGGLPSPNYKHFTVKEQTCAEGSGSAPPWQHASLASTFSPPDPHQRRQYGRRRQGPPAGGEDKGCQRRTGNIQQGRLSGVCQPKSLSLDVQFVVSEEEKKSLEGF